MLAGLWTKPPLWLTIFVAWGLATVITLGGPRLKEAFGHRNATSAPARQNEFDAEAGIIAPTAVASPTAEAVSKLPALFAAQGARIVINGPPRSGKTTVLHSLLRRALRDPNFSIRILLDGKANTLAAYAQMPNVTYYDANNLDKWIMALDAIAREMPARYQRLLASNTRAAGPGVPRVLLVIDDVRHAIRDPKFGAQIAQTLLLIAEQPSLLADVLILTTHYTEEQAGQREATFNANVVINLSSAIMPGSFTIRSSPTGPIEAVGQARYADDSGVAAEIAALLRG